MEQILVEKGTEKIEKPKIVVKTGENFLYLYDGSQPVKKYKISLGRSDYLLAEKTEKYITTPIGKFSVCRVKESKKFFKIYKLDYPDSNAILKAANAGFLKKEETEKMLRQKQYGCNLQNVNKKIFGPELTIHGYGVMDIIFRNLPFTFNWTNGSIALSNDDLKELAPFLKIGTKIIIAK